MNSMRMMGLVFALLCTVGAVNAAVFNVKNNSRQAIYVRPIWAGRPFSLDRLQPGQSKDYESLTAKPTAIHWVEVVSSGNGQMFLKGFEANIKLWELNLGGKFEILNDGSYSYMFGVDGSGNGSATKVDDL